MLKGEIINGGSIVSGGLVFQQNAKLPGNALKSVDFITVVDILSEGEIEGSATASKAGLTDKTSTAYKNAFLNTGDPHRCFFTTDSTMVFVPKILLFFNFIIASIFCFLKFYNLIYYVT